MKPKESGIAIIVALISLCGVLGAAVINNWDKFFPPPPTNTPPTYAPPTSAPPTENPTQDVPDNPATGCGGTVVDGFCWYFGDENLSCNTVCSSHGGYNYVTSTYAGSEGSANNCKNVLDALNIVQDDFFETTQGGLGCFAIQTTSGNYYGYWDEQPTSADATSVTPGRRRICACQQ